MGEMVSTKDFLPDLPCLFCTPYGLLYFGILAIAKILLPFIEVGKAAPIQKLD